jgi:hypothetical protein
VEAFDPRLYCLPEKGVSPFEAGAVVSARFGYPPKTKVVWKGGRHEEVLPDQPPPFLAFVIPARDDDDDDDDHRHRRGRKWRHDHERHAGRSAEQDDDEPEDPLAGPSDRRNRGHGAAPAGPSDAGGSSAPGDDDEGVDEDAEDQPTEGVKELHATPIELGSDYALPEPERRDRLALELVRGSDASSRAAATVTLKLTNHEKMARRIYLRRELASFRVTGPDGTITCDPQPDDRAPDRQAFTMLSAGRSITLTSRLAELCPDDVFQRPGLYVIEGRLDAFATGEEYGFDAFVGRLVSSRSVVVRVRSGSLPFPGPRLLERVRVGAL